MKNILRTISVMFLALFLFVGTFSNLKVNATENNQESVATNEVVEDNGDTSKHIINMSEEDFVNSLDEVSEDEVDEEIILKDNGLNHAIGKTLDGNVVYSNMTKEEIIAKNSGKDTKGVGNTISSNQWKQGALSTWIARLWIQGVGDVYCGSPGADFPTGQNYDAGTIYNDPGVEAILWYGFPSNIGGDRPANYDDNDAYNATYLALNTYLFPGGFSMVPGGYVMTQSWLLAQGDAYLNQLVARGNNGTVPNTDVKVTAPVNTTAYYNESTRANITDWYNVAGGSTVTISNLPTGVSIQLENGNIYENGKTINSNQKFRFYSQDLNFSGSAKPNFTSNVKKRAAIMYTAPGVQNLLGSGWSDPIVAQSPSANFVDTTSEGKLIKLDEDTREKITSGTVFETYVFDEATNEYTPYTNENIIQEPYKDVDGNEIWDLYVDPDTNMIYVPNLLEPDKSYELEMKDNYYITSNGEINLTNIPTMDIYFKEVVTPEGYVDEEDKYYPLYVEEGGQLYELEITNRIAKAIIEFEKLDKDSRLKIGGAKLKVEKFNFTTNEWEQFYVFTSKANENHTKELDYGLYRVVELVFPDGYVAKVDDKEFKVTKDDDNKIITVTIENIKELVKTGFSQNSYLMLAITLLTVFLRKIVVKPGIRL